MIGDVDADLTPQQRADLRLGEWIVAQRRRHAIEKFVCLLIGLGFGAALSRLF